jgi:hypothetical protein
MNEFMEWRLKLQRARTLMQLLSELSRDGEKLQGRYSRNCVKDFPDEKHSSTISRFPLSSDSLPAIRNPKVSPHMSATQTMKLSNIKAIFSNASACRFPTVYIFHYFPSVIESSDEAVNYTWREKLSMFVIKADFAPPSPATLFPLSMSLDCVQ